MRSRRSLVVSAVLVALPLVSSLTSLRAARADTMPVLGGPIDRVAAVSGGVAVLRGGEALLLDDVGRVVGRCAGARGAAGRALRRDGTTLSRERVLREAGFSDEDVSPEAEALLDDEGIDPPTRRRPVSAASGLPPALSLAATPDAAWVGTADGLWRLDARRGTCARAGLGGHALPFVAAGGGALVAVADVTVWASQDGASFTVATVLTSPARALALAADGSTAFVSTDDGVYSVTPPRAVRRVLDGPADALAACGPDVYALAPDGVYRLRAGIAPARLGDRPPARALACVAPTGPRLLAVGVGAWSTDDGRAWQEESVGRGRSFSAATFAAGRAWLAGDEGLTSMPPLGEAGPSPVGHGPSTEPVSRRAPPSWARLLPRLSLSFDRWTESGARAGWRLWFLITVSFRSSEVRE